MDKAACRSTLPKYLGTLSALIGLLAWSGCKTGLPVTEPVVIKEKPLPPAGVHLIQGTDSVLKSGQSLLIPMTREPFELIFPVQDYDPENRDFYAVQVLATNNSLLIDSFYTGLDMRTFKPFAGGSGMAAAEGGYTEMYVTDNGHHYLLWDRDNPENCRGQLLGDRDGRHVLSWRVDRVNYRNKSYPIGSIPAKGFTLIIFIDEDLDSIADSGEWYVADLRFTE